MLGWLLGAACVLVGLIVLLSRRSDGENRTTVLVLGDFGRSPRMQYHADSCSKLGPVDVVAYAGNTPHPHIHKNKGITVHHIKPFLVRYPRKLFLLVAPVKVVVQILQLVVILLWIPAPRRMLIQNPPAIPALIVAAFACKMRGCELVIDWHNFGYTILSLSIGERHPVCRIASIYERLVGRLAHKNLCVTHAMREVLSTDWGIKATVLHDRPPRFVFTEPTPERKLEVLAKVDDLLGESAFCAPDGSLNPDRPVLMISSTSWTADEDFSLLLSVAEALEGAPNSFPQIVAVITGKGDLRSHYEERIRALKLTKMRLICAWLEAEDYPVLLSCSDLGVSLHYSSSGLDLPMKVVDMFGAGIPVCQVRYENDTINELVTHEKTGLLFKDSTELLKQVRWMFDDWCKPDGKRHVTNMKECVLAEMVDKDWTSNWNNVARPLFV